MALRNAFGELGLEETLRQILRAVTYSRDSADRMRVTVDSAPQVTVFAANTSAGLAGSAIPPYSGVSWNAMDPRGEMQELSLQTFQNTRNRWSIT